MANPVEPNYKKDVGRLITDRYDFEKHLNGTDFRHNATQIDLYPTVVIDGSPKTNVQDAIKTLADIIYTPSLPEATATSLGVIKLSGDISGTAYNIIVNKIQGKPISTLVPTSGQVLTWEGAFWSPSDPINIFSAGLDLSGNNIDQRVVKISGNDLGKVTIPASSFTFSENSTPEFNQEDMASGNAIDFVISAQKSLASGNGGNVLISGGLGSSGDSGGVTLSLGGSDNKMLQASNFDSRRILALCGETTITSANVPSGDLMVYVKDTASPPDSGPIGGALLYSVDGQLHVRESSGNNFIIESISNESIPNPSIWGDATNQTYSYRSLDYTTAASVEGAAFEYVISDGYAVAVKVDVTMVGRESDPANNNAYHANMSAGYVANNNNEVIAVGEVITSDVRTTDGAFTWTGPNIYLSGSVISVITGYGDVNITWLTVVKLTIVQA